MSTTHLSPRAGRRRLSGLVSALVPALLLACTVGLCLLPLAGVRLLAVVSGSMEPTLRVGDLVVSRSVPVALLQPGDVVTFHSPTMGDALVTHRVERVQIQGDTVQVTTRGDANPASESWGQPSGGQVGRMMFSVPVVGWWPLWLTSPTGRSGLVIAACLLVTGWGLRRVWARA